MQTESAIAGEAGSNSFTTFMNERHIATRDAMPERSSDLSVEADNALRVAQAVMQTETPYRRLPEVFAPADGLEILNSMIERAPKYQEKYSAQESSLLMQVWALIDGEVGPDFAVVDIGAGNGCLALIAAIAFGSKAVLIDHTLPREELCVESYIPQEYRERILRITGDIKDVSLEKDLFPLLIKHGIKRAVVVAKHLCGLGTDLALSFVDRWKNCPMSPTTVVGATLATCCCHKIGQRQGLESYCCMYKEDPYLCKLVGDNEVGLHTLVSLWVRHVSWRYTAACQNNNITDTQVSAAELFEDVLQQPRLARLRELFPAAEEIVFVPQSHSLQNRCLLAGGRDFLEAAKSGHPEFLEALRAARDMVHALAGGPLVFKPRGLKSARFDYDGT